ncbi:family 43 glycosylhydrolase [Flavobacterium sp. Sd200]|uniref:glycoside hydrolase family 43 protein n=1 Tax=Flavobacterium sp. Sd200 TaxID=2692211 RepID=UPI00136987E9|nr:glycoside hydrolase family 43 protein [Flavobacterium sp. Sd200]MXN90403.1 family 43 glycosylhydrolase [Flavobacterium sp. Sd200]
MKHKNKPITSLKRLFASLLFIALPLSGAYSQDSKKKESRNAPVFTQFSYKGNDAIYEKNPLQPNEFYSPILQGCYPDPSITHKGKDYYLVNSSFAMTPGVPIFHSTDMVNWKQIGHVLDKPSQLKVEKSGISQGIYAPDIKYNPYNDTFYMITTQIAGGMGNMMVKTKDPAKGWGDAIKLQFDGIDPSLFFDDNGKAYVVHNDAPPAGTELYNGHRVIKLWEYDLATDKVIAGTDKILVNGGTDINQKPIWIEGPHMYKKDGRYFLMCAEGGTGDWHSEVIFSSDSPTGPFVPAKNNPILTQRYFAKDRKDKVDWAGHADLVEGPGGKYYAVFLAVRPNNKDRVNTGRETFMVPVDWSGEFPVFENGLVPLKPKLKMPEGVTNQTGKNGFFPNGNFTFQDQFKTNVLDLKWIGIRGWRESFTTLTKQGLKIIPFDTNIQAAVPTSTLFYRQQHASFKAETALNYKPGSEKELAGLVCYQNEKYNYVFGVTKKGSEYYVVLERTEKGISELVSTEKIKYKKDLHLQVIAQGDDYMFNYSVDGVNYKNVGGTVSGDILSTDVAGGFTGSLIGLYATSGNDIKP